MRLTALVLGLLGGLSGCGQPGTFGDGTSVSWGPSRKGVLLEPARLPDRGEGYWSPPRWRTRGLRYGTDELVSLIVHTGRNIERHTTGAKLGIADLSLAQGGRSRWHRSHQTGRDVDLLFMVRDASGKSLPSERMWAFDADGVPLPPKGGAVVAEGDPQPKIFFDDELNWVVVRSLLDNPIAEVQYIFVADWLKQRLIDHAIARGEPEELIQKAGYLLHQPSDSLAHDDHMHVRVYCSRTDVTLGCNDRGALRWVKKGYKYERFYNHRHVVQLLMRVPRQFQLLLTLATVPLRGFSPTPG